MFYLNTDTLWLEVPNFGSKIMRPLGGNGKNYLGGSFMYLNERLSLIEIQIFWEIFFKFFGLLTISEL